MKELKWQVPEYPQYERSFRWYVVATLIILTLVIYSVITGNFLFAAIIIIAMLLSIVTTSKSPKMVDFILSERGVMVENLFYPWERFQRYWLVMDETPHLGLDLKNILQTDLYVPVEKTRRDEVESFVAQYLQKDNERKGEPISYYIARRLKL